MFIKRLARSGLRCRSIGATSSGLRITESNTFKERVRKLFDKRAETYDATDRFHHDLATRLVRLAGIDAARELCILDMATGTGMVAFEAAKVNPLARVLGVDLSPSMVQQSAQKARKLGLQERVEFRVVDVDVATFPPGSFDTIFCSSAIIYFPDIEALIKKTYAWLKAGGRLVFNTPQEPCVPATSTFYKLFQRAFGVELLDAAAPLANKYLINDMLRASGFENITISSTAETILFPNVDDVGYANQLWMIMSAGNVYQPLDGLVDKSDLSQIRQPFLDEVTHAAQPWQTTEGVANPYTQLWVVAEKSV